MTETNYNNRASLRITQHRRIPPANEGKINELPCPFSSSKISIYYQVNLSTRWNNMPRYKYFVFDEIGSRRRFFRGDYVTVTNISPYPITSTAKVANPEGKKDWIAYIADIRGASPIDVHALVLWMYWPEALPRRAGRKKKYQQNELVASNHLGVIDVNHVDRVVPVKAMRKTRKDRRSQRLIWKDFFDRMHGSVIEDYAR